jgi:hypothetical protein
MISKGGTKEAKKAFKIGTVIPVSVSSIAELRGGQNPQKTRLLTIEAKCL